MLPILSPRIISERTRHFVEGQDVLQLPDLIKAALRCRISDARPLHRQVIEAELNWLGFRPGHDRVWRRGYGTAPWAGKRAA